MIEAGVNIVVGYSINVLAQTLIFPAFGVQVPLSANLKIGLAFTGISLTRNYLIRRVFNHFE